MSYRIRIVSQYRTFTIHTITSITYVVPCTYCKSLPYICHSYHKIYKACRTVCVLQVSTVRFLHTRTPLYTKFHSENGAMLYISLGENRGGPADIDTSKTPTKIYTTVGSQGTLLCHYSGYPTPNAIWMRDGDALKDCKRCVTKTDNATPGIAKLHVTPFRSDDFGKYVCKVRNENGFAEAVIELVQEPSDKTQCQKDLIAGKDPRLNLEFRPKCDTDGSYHRIQCSIHLQSCWCVDRHTGHKIAEVYKGPDGYHCTAPYNISTGSTVTMSIGIILLLIVTDIAAFAFCKRGITHFIVRYRNKRKIHNILKTKGEDESLLERGQDYDSD
ncbi:uncharacterized protein LOC116302278 [Actinia tenebrosa]|uniref:Uncharacterized protein LOC116302278 n=1 Tax=Actinia tenebrosa TaxID=6105 RepID=A0A6P8IL44_ACTTE|nr:uncharacterized protein LOC116302278 [Actinia tenebrosa]